VDEVRIVSIIDTLTGLKWKLAAGAGIVSILIISGFLAYAQIENRHLAAVNGQLDSRINDPKTGLLVTVAQCHTNAATAVGAVKQQNTALVEQSKKDQAALTETTRLLAIAQAQTKKAEAQAAVLLATKPRGATLEARVKDVDARLLETMK
jgi:hypothetical protein